MRSLGLATLIVAALALAGSFPLIGQIATLLVPGMLLAALIFPTGIHSDYGLTYMILAAVIDIMIVAVPIFFYLRLRQNRNAQTN